MMPLRIVVPMTLLFLAAFRPVLWAQTLEPVEDPRRPMTFEDMYKMGRVSDPQVSPDGKTVLYVVAYYSLETNKGNSDIWSVGFGKEAPVQLTQEEANDAHPRWSPDGKTVAFVSSREGQPQIYLMNPDGSNVRRFTNLSTGAAGVEWSPTGTDLLFTSMVFPDCATDNCNKERLMMMERNPIKARLIEKLPYRVWNSWKDGQYSHLFVAPLTGGTPQDITPGEYDCPPIDLNGSPDYAVSPDGQEIAYVKNTDALVAASTNNDVWICNLQGQNHKSITTSNKGNDNQPIYSPDGKYIAYRSMARAGYEADKYDLKLYERATGKTIILTEGFDRSVNEVMWTPDSKRILFTADDEAYVSLFEVKVSGGDILRVLKGIITLQFQEQTRVVEYQVGTKRTSFQLLPDGETLIFLGQRANYPPEVMSAVYRGDKVREFRQLTQTNADLLKELDMPAPESFTFKSFDGVSVQGWMLVPPGFDSTKKYPMIYLVHGGPQGVWGDEFHYRWNMELFAATGFVVCAVNPRGSQGFGQAFTDGVGGSWGGAPYKDLMTGLDYILKKYRFIDKDRIGAAGASYGGYMMNWFLGNTKRFKALFCHAGVYDLTSMYGGTEELWFPEWEFRGTPWTNQKMYDQWSPSRLAKNFSTPTYVSHGQQDFRVPVEQGMQLFTALQRKGIESKFLYFPDEGHLVLKPRNAQFWYRQFTEWFTKHLKK